MTGPGQHGGCERVPFDRAPGVISALAGGVGAPIAVVALGGPAGAGKSTLAERMSAVTLSTDWYLPDYDVTPEEQRDLPETSDLHLLASHLAALREGREVQAPVWSFHSHRREGSRPVRPGPIVVVEGIHALHASLLSFVHIPVFVEAPASLRWQRWERIESAGLRGWGVERARAYFDSVAEPTFLAREHRYRAAARIVVVNDAGLPEFGMPGK